MVNQKFLIFDYDDTIMPSVISRKLANQPDYGASQVKDRLVGFYRFLVYWKKTTGIPIIILSAGTIAYLHLISLFGKYLRISINYFDPRMDVCMFLPVPFTYIMTKQNNYLRLDNNNAVSTTLQNNMIKYYYNVFTKYPNANYYFIHPSQIEAALLQADAPSSNQKTRELVNGISHKKVVYVQKPLDPQSLQGCFYLPGVSYTKEVGFYEFLNCRRQFKNLDALRKHISFVCSKPATHIHFYFFDDRASHLGMGDNDIYLSKPHTYPSSFFVSKLLPILDSLMEQHDACPPGQSNRECMRRNEIKLLNRLVSRLSTTDKLMFVAKHDGASPVAKRKRGLVAKKASKSGLTGGKANSPKGAKRTK